MTRTVRRAVRLIADPRPAFAAAAVVLGAAAATLPASAYAAAAVAVATVQVDVLVMEDGREFEGKVIEDRRDAIVFEMEVAGITTRVTYLKSEIREVRRDVASSSVAAAEDEAVGREDQETPVRGARRAEASEQDDPLAGFGARRASEAAEGVASFYIVPMKRQMGTDVHPEIYKQLVDEIRQVDPDYLIIELDCQDFQEGLYNEIPRQEGGMDGSEALDMYRKLVDLFRDDLRDIRQIVWVNDSVGISSVIAMAWPEIYMKPTARYGGLAGAAGNFMFVESDRNTFGKYREAYMAWLKGFAENSGRAHELVNAMVLPDFKLSATWKGREVEWSNDESGEYLVDDSDGATANFRARDAENLRISEGTAETLDDLALLLGVREYYVVDGSAEQRVEDYIEDWRRVFESAIQSMLDYQKYQGWATGADTRKYLGRSLSELKKVRRSLDRYEAVELRLAQDYGISKLRLDIMIDQLEERIAALNNGSRGGGGRAGGGSGFGG